MTLMTKDITQSHDWTLFHGDAIDILPSYVGYIDFCFTSPSPYRYDNDQHLGIGSEQTVSDYIHNLISLFDRVKDILTDDGSLWVDMVDGYNPDIGGLLFIPERFALTMLQRGWLCKGKLIWQRLHPMSEKHESLFRYNWEYIYWFSKSKDPYFDSHGGKYGYTSVFDYPLSSWGGFSKEILNIAIDSCCPEHGIVLDPLCSTGSTGAEALRLKRKFIGIEIMQERYKVAVENLKGIDK